jgi:hypothetical protein
VNREKKAMKMFKLLIVAAGATAVMPRPKKRRSYLRVGGHGRQSRFKR